LGYLALPELSKADPRGVSGNYGILDLQFALQWVQKNIKSFGGDPARVTLLGQSSGGTNIFSLLSSPASKNLFSAAISLSGSPNISMNLAQAEELHRKQFLEITPCAGVPDVLGCLMNLSAIDINLFTPGCFNTPIQSVPPLGVNGTGWCGLTIADGYTVHDLFDATSHGLIDVPLIIQISQAEADFFGLSNQYNMAQSELDLFMSNYFNFDGWANDAFIAWRQLYQYYISQSTELTLFGFLTDVYFTCGTQQLAVSAGKGFKSPVYLGIINYPPSHPHPTLYGEFAKYAFHSWDYQAATGAWALWSQGVPYTPNDNDIQFGKTQLGVWYQLASTGRVSTNYGWAPVNAAVNFPTDFQVGVLINPSGYTSIQNYYNNVCQTLTKPPLNFNQIHWVIN